MRKVLMVLGFLFGFGSSMHAQTLHWKQTNGPYGGYVSCFLAGTSTIFAGLLDGGIYRSDDAGNTWIESDSGLIGGAQFGGVKTLASRGHTLFAGGAWGGIYRSTDGILWTSPDSTPGHLIVNSFCVTSSRIFAAG